MKRGDVYCANLNPVFGSEQGGCRPVVIIQNDTGNKFSGTTIVAPMTSRVKPRLPIHVPVSEDDNLHPKTVILLEQIRAIDKKRLEKFYGSLSERTMKKVDAALGISIALNKEETEKEGEVMNEPVRINKHDVDVKEYNGQRVVTFKDIDMVHERPDGTAGRNFRENKKHFIEGEDYFRRNPSEAKMEYDIVAPNGLTLLTESGYLMLVKSFTDELAWSVQRKLVKIYFNRKKRMSPEEMMRVQLGMIDGHEERISKLEDTMNIDYGQQRVLEKEVGKVVIEHLSGKESPAYKEMGKKVFSECNRDVKDYFHVNSRNNIPRIRFDDAVEYIRGWIPCTNTRAAIQECNAQIEMRV